MIQFEVSPSVVRARIAACFGLAVTSMPKVKGSSIPLPGNIWFVEVDLIGQQYHLIKDFGGMQDTVASYQSVTRLLKSLRARKLIKA